MKTQKKRASTDDEIEADVVQRQAPEIRIVKGKKRHHKRDGCGGGGGGGGGGSFSGGGSVGPSLAGLAGNSPVDVEIVKATRDIPMGAVIRDQDIEDVSALEYQQSGGKISKKMATRSMVRNRQATEKIPKGAYIQIDKATKKITAIH